MNMLKIVTSVSEIYLKYAKLSVIVHVNTIKKIFQKCIVNMVNLKIIVSSDAEIWHTNTFYCPNACSITIKYIIVLSKSHMQNYIVLPHKLLL